MQRTVSPFWGETVVFFCKKTRNPASIEAGFLELVIRVELMTSSLPMTCSTN